MYLKISHLAFLLIVLSSLSSCRVFKKNGYKNKQQHGYWITYTDNSKKTVLTRGRFNNGVQVGKWIYNDFKGNKERVEIYRGKKMKITHFHPNGKIALKGKAKIVNDSAKLHFYYYGPWYFYNERGSLQKISYFENGNLISEDIKLPSINSVYDSLAVELLKLDKDFTKYRDTLQKTQKAFGIKSEQYKTIWQLNKQNDSLIYLRIQNITSQFGYPTKKQVGENNSVIFYIIGFAPITIKEQYLELFRKAAIDGEIALSDFAFSEDKVMLAKYGCQLYGTQYKVVNNTTTINYPVIKLSELNERRKKMNLEEVNLLEYKAASN